MTSAPLRLAEERVQILTVCVEKCRFGLMPEAVKTSNVVAAADSRTSQVAKAAFFRIMDEWGVGAEDARQLLGAPSRSTFFGWKKGEGAALSRDTLERVSYVLGIYKGLQLLLPEARQADAWVKKPNKAFGGKSALERMLAGNVADLQAVRAYIDYVRGGPA
jgi:Protein of unknown function (DUF2384)